MSVHMRTDQVVLHHGDCIEVMRELADESVHAIVTDPPYGLDFMGKGWDSPQMLGQLATGDEQRGAFAYGGTHSRGYADHDGAAFGRWVEVWAREALRVLKPGGHLLAFGGSRTWHRLAAGIEDAGFEMRDSIAWLYGSGFPKSLDVSKALDAREGIIRGAAGAPVSSNGSMSGGNYERTEKGDPVSEAAQRWAGWGTALKPAFEPIVVARKPLSGTVAANVLAHGTGALNIHASRTGDEVREAAFSSLAPAHGNRLGAPGTAEARRGTQGEPKTYTGRWPTNVVLDESQAAELDAQSGVSRSRVGNPRSAAAGDGWGMTHTGAEYSDEGGASRFFPTFRYEAKAPTHERPVDGEVAHPTVKPLDLMRWLVRLVTPPGGTVLEPFAGSGTTLEAAVLEGFSCIGIEREADYLPLIEKRLSKPMQQSLFGDWDGAA